MDHHTLQEFLHTTKSVSYLIAVIIMVCFIPFWLFLTDREKKKQAFGVFEADNNGGYDEHYFTLNFSGVFKNEKSQNNKKYNDISTVKFHIFGGYWVFTNSNNGGKEADYCYAQTLQ